VGKSIRYSRTLDQNMMYLAQPLKRGEQIIGVIRTSLPLTAIERRIRSTQIQIAVGGILIALLAGMISLYVSKRITHPIELLKDIASQFANGDFSRRLPVTTSIEIDELADTLNSMAQQLDQRIHEIVQQRNEREAVLSSMIEGVIAIDRDARIININQTASGFFNRLPDDLQHRRLHEVFRNPDLNRFVDRALAVDEKIESDLTFYGKNERILHARSTTLRNGQQQRIGTLLVLNDVTHLRRLERMREDFAANVSHEIKTPLTAIKGFVETLRSGALDDTEEAQRFLVIIEKHVNRLSAIIEDLMNLAQIEKTSKRKSLQLEDKSLIDTVKTAVGLCQEKAKAKGISLTTDCQEVSAPIDATLMEQACLNLLDNAINYSDPNSTVHVSVTKANELVHIRVKDHGIGIPAKHLPRLFERFYRVDKARSRKAGGTGLGLAIVKHIVQAHQGEIQVESLPGKGSTFTITLPAMQ